VLIALRQLAHNVLVWARRFLAAHAPQVRDFGIKRLVRAVFGVRGVVARDAADHVRAVVLNQADPLAPHLLTALCALAAATAIPIRLGETERPPGVTRAAFPPPRTAPWHATVCPHVPRLVAWVRTRSAQRGRRGDGACKRGRYHAAIQEPTPQAHRCVPWLVCAPR